MNLYRWSNWAWSRPDIAGCNRRPAGSTIGVVLVSIWLLSAAEFVSVKCVNGQDRPAQAGSQTSPAIPDGLAPGPQDAAPSTDGEVAAQPAQAQHGQEQNDQLPKAEWLFAPIPMSSPAIGSGLEWAVARVFPLSMQDKTSPTSVVGVGGLITNNGSRALALGGKLHFNKDEYRLTGFVGYASINADIYGIGKNAGDRGVFVPLTGNGSGLLAQFLFRLKKDVYLGPRAQYRNLSISVDWEELGIPDSDTDTPEDIRDLIDQVRTDLSQQQTVSIGPRFEWDTRDNAYYPKRGFLLDYYTDFFAESLGSEFSYQYTKFAFNKYNGMSEHQVIAFRGMGCAATGGHVPIYDLCLFGNNNDLRGYTAGRYQDRRMFAAQAEYRLSLPVKGFLGRFGVVGFAGFGAVSPEFTSIGFSDLLPGGGGGIRFRLTKENPINFRVDVGFGKVGHTLNIGIAEAF